jgi:hypothetical protein
MFRFISYCQFESQSCFQSIRRNLNKNGGNRTDIGIIGDESNIDAAFVLLLQFFRQVVPPSLNDNIFV